MSIKGIEGLTTAAIKAEVAGGAKFVMYQYCISLLVITFKRSSGIYFIRSGESAVGPGIVFTLLSLVLGWWGIPWGPIYTIEALVVNFKGGRDVTAQVMASVNASAGIPVSQA